MVRTPVLAVPGARDRSPPSGVSTRGDVAVERMTRPGFGVGCPGGRFGVAGGGLPVGRCVLRLMLLRRRVRPCRPVRAMIGPALAPRAGGHAAAGVVPAGVGARRLGTVALPMPVAPRALRGLRVL